MKLLEAMKHAARFSFSPKYSLFHCSAKGEYTLIVTTSNPEEIVERFKAESLKPETVGLEVRCDGVRVSFDGV